MKIEWTQELIEQMLSLRAKGVSSSQIAKIMGMTKGMVSGKLNRLGVEKLKVGRKPSAPKKKKREISKVPSAPKPPKEPFFNGVVVNILDLTSRTCCFPIGDPKHNGFGFCGEEIHKKSYCEYHYNIAYRKGVKNANRKHTTLCCIQEGWVRR